MNESNCPMWDEYNNCCMWERVEKIIRLPWEEREVPQVIKDCMEEMP